MLNAFRLIFISLLKFGNHNNFQLEMSADWFFMYNFLIGVFFQKGKDPIICTILFNYSSSKTISFTISSGL